MLYYANVTIHVLAAMLWLGGMFFLAAVGAPVLRTVEPPAVRSRLFGALGRQFRLVGWIAIGILVLTGIGNLYFKGLLRADIWTNPAFWATGLGVALAWKLAMVTVMIVISGVHDWISGPAASRMEPGSAEALRARRRAALWARVNAVAGIVLVIAAVRLARS